MLRDKYRTRQSQVLCLSQDKPPSAVFYMHTSTGSALSVILYFQSQASSRVVAI